MKKSVLALVAMMAVSSVAFAKTNINMASEQELAAIHDIGPVKAKSMVDYRAAHGDFKSLKDLEKVPGFSHTTVSKLSKELTVSGATTTPAKQNTQSPTQK